MNSLKRRLRLKSPSGRTTSSLEGDANQTANSNGHLASNSFQCKIHLLHEKQEPLDIIINKNSLGSQLFDEVCERLGGLCEKDYFGLRFTDKDKHPQWFDLNRNAYKQLKHLDSITAKFRVKHYPPNPVEDLRQGISRYLLYLQLRRDFQSGRLLCDPEESYQLGALVAQAEFGDYEDIEKKENYLSIDLKVICNQTAKSEEKIMKIHAELNGLTAVEAETEFIRKASKLDTYGVLPFQVKDQKGNLLYIGLTHQGLVTFQGSRRTLLFRWNEIFRFAVDGKHFLMYIPTREDTPYQKKRVFVIGKQKRQMLSFKCDSKSNAACLWKWAVDQQLFFSLNHSSEAKRIKSGTNLFKKSRTFVFSGKCQKEVLDVSAHLTDSVHTPFVRGSSLRRHPTRGEDGDSSVAKFATFPRRARGKVLPPDLSNEEEIIMPSSNRPALASPPVQMLGDVVNQSDCSTNVEEPCQTQVEEPVEPDIAPMSANTVSVVVSRGSSRQKRCTKHLPVITVSSSENELVKIFPSEEDEQDEKMRADFDAHQNEVSSSDSESNLPEDEVPLLLDVDAEEDRLEEVADTDPTREPFQISNQTCDDVDADFMKCKIAVWEDFEEALDDDKSEERSLSCPDLENSVHVDPGLAFCSVNIHSINDSMTFPFEWTKSFKSCPVDCKLSESEPNSESYDVICQPSEDVQGDSTTTDKDCFIRKRSNGLQNSEKSEEAVDEDSNVRDANGHEQSNKTPDENEHEENNSAIAIWKIILVFVLTVMILFVIGLVPFFEARIHSGSVLRHVRYHPHVEQFYQHYYQPLRTTVVKYFQP